MKRKTKEISDTTFISNMKRWAETLSPGLGVHRLIELAEDGLKWREMNTAASATRKPRTMKQVTGGE